MRYLFALFALCAFAQTDVILKERSAAAGVVEATRPATLYGDADATLKQNGRETVAKRIPRSLQSYVGQYRPQFRSVGHARRNRALRPGHWPAEGADLPAGPRRVRFQGG